MSPAVALMEREHVGYDDIIAEMEWDNELATRNEIAAPAQVPATARSGHTGGDGKVHAILGASSSDRWMRCPGSVRMSRGMPNRSSKYAQEGTVAHHLCELSLAADVAPHWFIGQFLNVKGELTDEMQEDEDPENMCFEIDDDMADAVAVYTTEIERIWEDLCERYPTQVKHRFLEKGFDLSRLYPDMFGTNDYSFFVIGEELIVIDYKHGRGKVVEAKNNPQLLYYALGAILAICTNRGELPHTIRTVIVQPRAVHRDGFIRSWDYTLQEVMDFSKELIRAAKRTEDPEAILVPGEIQCTFCNGKPRPCPALYEHAQEQAMSDFTDLDADELTMVVGAKTELTDVGRARAKQMASRVLTDRERIAVFLKMAPVFDSMIRDIEAYAQHEHENGRPIYDKDGNQPFKLVRRRSNRKIRDKEDAIKELTRRGISEDDMYAERKLKSPAQLEKVKAVGKTLVAELSYTPQGQLTLVPMADARPAIDINPFDDLNADELLEANLGGEVQGIIEGEFRVVLALPAPDDDEPDFGCDEDEWDIL